MRHSRGKIDYASFGSRPEAFDRYDCFHKTDFPWVLFKTGELMLIASEAGPDHRKYYPKLKLSIISTADLANAEYYTCSTDDKGNPVPDEPIPKAHLNRGGQQILIVDHNRNGLAVGERTWASRRTYSEVGPLGGSDMPSYLTSGTFYMYHRTGSMLGARVEQQQPLSQERRQQKKFLEGATAALTLMLDLEGPAHPDAAISRAINGLRGRVQLYYQYGDNRRGSACVSLEEMLPLWDHHDGYAFTLKLYTDLKAAAFSKDMKMPGGLSGVTEFLYALSQGHVRPDATNKIYHQHVMVKCPDWAGY